MPVLSSPQLLACSTELGYALGFSYPEARGSLSPTSTPCTRCCLPSFLMWPSAIMRSLKSPGMSTLAWLTSWRSAVSFLLPGFYQGKKKKDRQWEIWSRQANLLLLYLVFVFFGCKNSGSSFCRKETFSFQRDSNSVCYWGFSGIPSNCLEPEICILSF